MSFHRRFLILCVTLISCSILLAQANSESDQQDDADKNVTEAYGDCTFGYGTDGERYIQPYVSCTAGSDTFAIFGREDGTWGLLLSPYENDRADDEVDSHLLNVVINVDDNDAHEFVMWATDWNVVLHTLETSEITPLFDELREGNTMRISRNDEEFEFDVGRANQAFTDLFFKQLAALSSVGATSDP